MQRKSGDGVSGINLIINIREIKELVAQRFNYRNVVALKPGFPKFYEKIKKLNYIPSVRHI